MLLGRDRVGRRPCAASLGARTKRGCREPRRGPLVVAGDVDALSCPTTSSWKEDSLGLGRVPLDCNDVVLSRLEPVFDVTRSDLDEADECNSGRAAGSRRIEAADVLRLRPGIVESPEALRTGRGNGKPGSDCDCAVAAAVSSGARFGGSSRSTTKHRASIRRVPPSSGSPTTS